MFSTPYLFCIPSIHPLRSSVLIAVPLVLLMAANSARAEDTAATAPAAPATDQPAAAESSLPAISVARITPRALVDRVIATGLIAPVEEVQVQPLIEGQPIDSLLADVGDMVTEGQVLAELSKTSLELQKAQSVASRAAARATVAQAEAQMVEAESSAAEAGRVAERTNRLKAQGTASQAATDTANSNAVAATARVSVARQSLEAARAQLALSDAQLANVELMLTRTEVRAPYAGRILARNATIGAVASATGQPMFVLEKDGALELRADLAEADVLRVTPGLPAELRPVGLSQPLPGTVRMIEPAIDTTTRLGRARIALDQNSPLRSGMFAEASIIIAQREALSAPLTAISTSNGESRVLRVGSDGKVEAVSVTLGIRDGAWVEVGGGLQAGDLIVTKAGAFVRAGDRITPVVADTDK